MVCTLQSLLLLVKHVIGKRHVCKQLGHLCSDPLVLFQRATVSIVFNTQSKLPNCLFKLLLGKKCVAFSLKVFHFSFDCSET